MNCPRCEGMSMCQCEDQVLALEPERPVHGRVILTGEASESYMAFVAATVALQSANDQLRAAQDVYRDALARLSKAAAS